MTRVLVVDDNGLLAELLRAALQDEGYCVRTAAGAAEAYAAILERWPDVLLLDVHLPGIDGWTFLGVCRRDPWAVELPVLMLAPPCQGLPRGGHGVAFLPKPFDLDCLTRAMGQLVAASRLAPAGSASRHPAPGEPVSSPWPRGARRSDSPPRWDGTGNPAPVLRGRGPVAAHQGGAAPVRDPGRGWSAHGLPCGSSHTKGGRDRSASG